VNDAQVLPQMSGEVVVTDGGIETDLIFNRGVELPEFASFVLLDDANGERELIRYFSEYLEIADETGFGVVLETATWRANPDWASLLGYDNGGLRRANERAVQLLLDLRAGSTGPSVVVSGCIGPRGDAYSDLGSMAADEAERYHAEQIAALAGAGADLVTALTLTNTAEAIGIARAARERGIPSVISFTVETDGSLPDGTALADAIRAVDDATDDAPAYFMINCAHPEHFAGVFDTGDPALARIGGVRANASRQSHEELDEAEELDSGDHDEFGSLVAKLNHQHPGITVLGGCCGTDARHIAAVARALGVHQQSWCFRPAGRRGRPAGRWGQAPGEV
jgi:S-methylmethionine-dependent homocysteine/selenocysteine methylase